MEAGGKALKKLWVFPPACPEAVVVVACFQVARDRSPGWLPA